MVSAVQLATARPGAWQDAAGGWRALARAAITRADAVDAVRIRLASDWRGPAATAATAAIAAVATALRAVRGPAFACDQALCEHATEVAGLQRRLGAPPSALASASVAESPAVMAVLLAAEASDGLAATRLAAAGFGVAAERPDVAERPGTPALPEPGADPAGVRRWWDSLAPAERHLLLVTDPRGLGALDGVPVAVRDTANRQVLDQVLAGTPPGERHDVLAALEARLQRTEPARAYLVAFDPAADGRAVVAIGDPDHARHVVTNVPGAGADLGDLRGLLARTDRIAAAAGDGVSSVLWLGYDAPEWLSATGTGAARDGADDLDRYAEGLRASATAAPAHHTIVGHSYGSLVVGTAAREHGLPVDDVVFVGSPGVGADRANDLGAPAGHVWASTAEWDIIRGAALADRALEWLDRDVTEDRWHGTDPGHPAFGGRSFSSDPGSWHDPVGAHNAYFDEGNAALAAIGAIARGNYAAVR
jgi:hypothetical protein